MPRHIHGNLVEDMRQSEMVREATDLMRIAVEKDIETSILINNRVCGNAPEIAQKVSGEFL